jgi:hypothetical protein
MEMNVFHLLAVLLILTLGCSDPTYLTVKGQVIHRDSTDLRFASDSIELQSVSDPKLIAYGGLSETGEFNIESLVNGKIMRGVPAGKYRVRLVVSDDDYEHKKLFASKIDQKYSSYERSGWSLEVPSNNVSLEISGPSKSK